MRRSPTNNVPNLENKTRLVGRERGRERGREGTQRSFLSVVLINRNNYNMVERENVHFKLDQLHRFVQSSTQLVLALGNTQVSLLVLRFL